MTEYVLVGLANILVLGVCARWANHPQVRREVSAAMTSLQAKK